MTEMPSIAELSLALTQVNKKFSVGLRTTLVSYSLFLCSIILTNLQHGHGNIKILFIKTLPLLIFIPAFIKQYPRTYSWLCFAILPYFVFITPSLFEAFAWSHWIQIFLTVIIFIASMMTSRWLQQKSYLQWQISNTPTN